MERRNYAVISLTVLWIIEAYSYPQTNDAYNRLSRLGSAQNFENEELNFGTINRRKFNEDIEDDDRYLRVMPLEKKEERTRRDVKPDAYETLIKTLKEDRVLALGVQARQADAARRRELERHQERIKRFQTLVNRYTQQKVPRSIAIRRAMKADSTLTIQIIEFENKHALGSRL